MNATWKGIAREAYALVSFCLLSFICPIWKVRPSSVFSTLDLDPASSVSPTCRPSHFTSNYVVYLLTHNFCCFFFLFEAAAAATSLFAFCAFAILSSLSMCGVRDAQPSTAPSIMRLFYYSFSILVRA